MHMYLIDMAIGCLRLYNLAPSFIRTINEHFMHCVTHVLLMKDDEILPNHNICSANLILLKHCEQ